MERPQIMGVVNVTPDSFWSPSRVSGVEEACRRMAEMRAQGADIIDIGAVSSRPGAAEVPQEEEWARLEPVLCGIDGSVRISIDTTRSAIIRRAVTLLGAKLGEKYAKTLMVNDISAGEDDCEMLDTAASYGLTYVAMHKRGTPADMDGRTDYGGGVVSCIESYFDAFAERARSAGMDDWILDPGFGFAKTEAQNLELLDNLNVFKRFGKPVLVGIADKRFTGGRTESLHALALEHGADILRVHDVAAAVKTLRDNKFL